MRRIEKITIAILILFLLPMVLLAGPQLGPILDGILAALAWLAMQLGVWIIGHPRPNTGSKVR